MKKTFYLITALAGLLFVATSVKAQYGYGFNSADPNIVFTGGNNPAAPDWRAIPTAWVGTLIITDTNATGTGAWYLG